MFKDTLILLDDNNLALNQVSRERETLIKELQTTIKEIKILRGIIPVCAICKNIRNDEGYYEEITAYLRDHSEADFSHTICPSCLKKHYPEEFKMMKSKQKKEK